MLDSMTVLCVSTQFHDGNHGEGFALDHWAELSSSWEAVIEHEPDGKLDGHAVHWYAMLARELFNFDNDNGERL